MILLSALVAVFIFKNEDLIAFQKMISCSFKKNWKLFGFPLVSERYFSINFIFYSHLPPSHSDTGL